MSHGRRPAALALCVASALAALGALYVAVQGALNLDLLRASWGPAAGLAPAGGLLGAAAAAVLARDARAGRVPRAATVLAAGPCVLVVWVGWVQAFDQPYERLRVEASLGLAVAVWSVLVVPALRRGRIPTRAVALALGVALGLVAAEVGLRVWALLAPDPLLVHPRHGAAVQLAAQRLAPGEVRHGFAGNARGFYDEPFLPAPERDGPLLAVIADSFGVGVVPHALHFTTFLERLRPGLEVYSFGVPGVGPPVYAELLEREVLPLEPDAVVVCLFVGNDLSDLGPVSGLDDWLRVALDGERLMLRQVAARLDALRRAGTVWARAPAVAAPGRPVEPPEETFARLPWLRSPAEEPPSMSAAAYRELIADRAPFVCEPDPARVATAVEIVAGMAAAAAPRPFAAVLIPAEFQVEDAWWRVAEQALAARGPEALAAGADAGEGASGGWAAGGAGLGGEAAGEPARGDGPRRDAAQRALTAGLEAAGVRTLDLLPVLRAVPPLADGDRHLYHRHDTHFNARGNRVVAQALDRFLGAGPRR